jgi:glutamate formiminotransferase/formiminotetrahydrofolate cyclodeaminase
MSARKVVECVPNFSEGRDAAVIDAISQAIKSVNGASLLDVDPGADTNRTVYTFVGDPEAVEEAAVRAAKAAYERIDMSRHTGAHPRMGALDVCPFIPVSGISMDECVEISRKVGERIATELGVPVYFYERSATRESRRSLADIRAGEYEALPSKLGKAEWAPDVGPAAFVPKWGATVVGAREFLIAYNVNVNATDKKLANEIALNIREGGRAAKDSSGATIKDANGQTLKVPGRLKHVRAIGWYIDTYGCAQVSINLLDYKQTPLHVEYETAREEAEKLGMLVTGSELVGLVPLEPLVEAGKYFLTKMGKSPGASERELIAAAVRSMGLDSVAPFDPDRKIIELCVRPASPLASMDVAAFVDEVASESPAPGGGSVAALSGALGAALQAMVANLTVGKKGYEAAFDEMRDMASKAQAVKKNLVEAIDADTAAFNDLMEAMKLPKATEDQKAVREAAMQEGYKKAARVPLDTAIKCLEALEFAFSAASRGNSNSASDAGVGALMARCGVEGAALNVLINLPSIKDEVFKRELRAEAERLIEAARKKCDEVLAIVRSKF